MPVQNDYQELLFAHNYTGIPSGTFILPGFIPSFNNGNLVIDYTVFQNSADVSSAGYYSPYTNINNNIASTTYKQNAEDAFIAIMQNNFGAYSVLFDDVAKIDFQEAASGTGEITFGQLTDGFPSFSLLNSSTSAITVLYNQNDANASQVANDIWINTEHDSDPLNPFAGENAWDKDAQITPGTEAFKILLEEVSHSLGIDIVENSPNSELKSLKYTVTAHTTNPHPDVDETVLPTGLGLFDIAALQEIYGVNTTTRNEALGFDDGDGNVTGTTYGIGKGFGAGANDAFVYTIWDAGGATDTIDATGYQDGVQIDLREGHFSSIGKNGNPNGDAVVWDSTGYDAGNVAIAYGTIIENAIGTSWDDDFTGNSSNNTFFGGFGDDIYHYSLGGGNDTIFDSAGALDRIIFDASIGATNLDLSQSGNDLIIDITGGGQVTVTDHFLSTSKIENMILSGAGNVIVGSNQNDNEETSDLVGTGFDDVMFGLDGADNIIGGAGSDILYGGAGDDLLIGKGTSLLEGETFEKDTLYGGIGNDTLIVGSGGQFIPGRVVEYNVYGEDGNDFILHQELESDTSFSTLYGGAGDDFIEIVWDGNITSMGGSGNDLYVSSHRDFQTVQNFEDISGNDKYAIDKAELILDHSGNDTYYLNPASGPQALSRTVIDDRSGFDTLNFDVARVDEVFGTPFAQAASLRRFFVGWKLFDDGSGLDNQIHLESVTQAGMDLEVGLNKRNFQGVDYMHTLTIKNHFAGTGGQIEKASFADVQGVDFGAFLSMINGTALADANLQGTNFSDIIAGGAGDDNLFGGGGDDVLGGENDNDSLNGEDGNDILNGGAGDDILLGGAGDDTLTGGAGNDNFLFTDLSEITANTDHITDFSADDEIDLSGISGLIFIGDNAFSNTVGEMRYVFETGTTAIEIDSTGDGVRDHRIVIDNGEFDLKESITGSLKFIIDDGNVNPLAQDDDFTVLKGLSLTGNVLVDNGNGVDSDAEGHPLNVVPQNLTTAQGGTVSILANGDFTYEAASGFLGFDSFDYTLLDSLGGGDTGSVSIDVQQSVITGTIGDDVLTGTLADDVIDGLAGNDVIDGAEGDDVLNGGAGDDTYYYNLGDGNDVITDTDGNDHIILGPSINLSNFASFGDGTNLILQVSDTLNPGQIIVSNYFVNPANEVETIQFSIDDGNGGTTLAGLNITGSNNNETLTGTGFFDYIRGRGGDDILHGAGGDDRLRGDDGNDTLYGEDGNDRLEGRTGDDTLFGGAGDDTLEGRDGSDTYHYNLGDGNDTIIDTSGVADRIILGPSINLSNFASYGDGSGALILEIFDTQNPGIIRISDYFTNPSNQIETIQFSIDDGNGGTTLAGLNITGTSGNDTLNGTSFFDYLRGRNGDDTLYGGAGDDRLRGDSGNDTLYGEDGDDRMEGRSGDDLLEGGAGSDNYRYSLGEGIDTIEDTSGTNDVIILGAGITQGDVTITETGLYDLEITFAGSPNDKIIIKGQRDATNTKQIEKLIFNDGSETDLLSFGINLIQGTPSNNVLNGTMGADQIEGLGGHDTIYGDGGNDIIIGGTGNDTLRGEDGDDTFLINGSGGGVDRIYGGTGTDTIQGSAGDDDIQLSRLDVADSVEVIDGGAGTNTIAGNASNNVLNFSATSLSNIDQIEGLCGHDTITGSAGNDTIIGGTGNDTLRGEDGDDTFLISGVGDGVDRIYGGAGTDTILGSAGDDAIQLSRLDVADSIEIIDGGAGVNIVSGNASNNVLNFSATTFLNIDHIDGGNGHDTITGSAGNNTIIGGSGNDTLRGEGGDDTFIISGVGDGVDRIYGGAGTDTIQGGAGTDTIQLSRLDASDSIEIIDGGAGSNVVAGNGSNNVLNFSGTTLINIGHINGMGGHDTITGSAGNDTIIGAAGNDTMRGEDGDDTFIINGNGDGVDRIYGGAGTDTILGGSGDDTIQLSRLDAADSIEIIDGNAGTDAVAGNASNNVLNFSATTLTNIAAIEGLGGHDTITGSAGNDTIIGGAGNDTMRGGAGDDTFLVNGTGDGVDRIYGEGGSDTILGSGGDDDIQLSRLDAADSIEIIDGGTGNNRVLGNASNNVLNFTAATLIGIAVIEGLGGHDTITGSAGNDMIIGGAGNDTLRGEDGDDTFLINGAGDGVDRIYGGAGTDTIQGGSGDDTIQLSRLDAADSIDVIDGGLGVNVVAGNASNNVLDFSAATLSNIDHIAGLGGHDTITGSSGSDTIKGGTGNDTIKGGSGDDVLYGEDGLDGLWGELGADTFVFESATAFNNVDKVHDFSTAEGDAIDIADLLTGYDPLTDAITDFVQITDNGTHSYLSVDADGGADNFVQMAELRNVIGLTDEELLETSGNLFAA